MSGEERRTVAKQAEHYYNLMEKCNRKVLSSFCCYR